MLCQFKRQSIIDPSGPRSVKEKLAIIFEIFEDIESDDVKLA
jgi:hypothetical protein